VGTLGTNSITGIPAGTDITITGTLSGCSTPEVVSIVSPTCPVIPCTPPQLSINGFDNCGLGTYTVSFTTDASNVSASHGTVVGSTVIGIPLGQDVTITAGTGSCTSTVTAIGPSVCPPASCTLPTLNVANSVCDGVGSTTYSVTFSSSDVISVSPAVGTIGTNAITGIPLGTDITITAGTGSCSVSVLAYSPASCADPCSNGSLLSVGSPLCSSGTYDVHFSSVSGVLVSVSPNVGTLGTNSITGIPAGTDITITGTLSGCSTPEVVSITAPSCPAVPTGCTEPQLTITGVISCGSGTYTINFISNGTVTSDFGTISGNSIIDIPLGQDVTVTSTIDTCSISATAVGPSVCPDDCEFPVLSVGNPICDGVGSGTYSVVVSVDSSTISISSDVGTVQGSTISGIPIGTDVTISAASGACVASVIILSPLNCDDPCEGTLISLVGTLCSLEDQTYGVALGAMVGVQITSDFGQVNGYSIVDIPLGQDVFITATHSSCIQAHELLVIAPDCEDKSEEVDLISVPNAFSPNGDGVDDFFFIRGLSGKVASIFIYNNWGNLVYQSDDYQNNWDGTCKECVLKGDGLPTSTYYYILDIKENTDLNTNKRYTGFIYLAR